MKNTEISGNSGKIVNMSSIKTNLDVMQFFSNSHLASLSTKEALCKFNKSGLHGFNIKVKDVNYDKEKDVCKQYGVYGVPVTLVFRNDKLIGRHYGEITSEEFRALFRRYSEYKSDSSEGTEK
ncbi:MAG: thioredoxin family protein [Desulfobacterales bacterium]|nr:thioredoxin family protein [Desulfobacterales bacterium]